MDDSHKWQFFMHNRSLHLPTFICRLTVSCLPLYTLKTTFWELVNTHNRLYIYHIFFNLDFIYSPPSNFQNNSHLQELNSLNFFLIYFLILPEPLYHLLHRRYRELQLFSPFSFQNTKKLVIQMIILCLDQQSLLISLFSLLQIKDWEQAILPLIIFH